jgi:glycosyltransferase involved in cell wall biosynthesis
VTGQRAKDRPLRILHIIDGLGVGGAEIQLVRLLTHLPRDRFAHVVVHLNAETDLAPRVGGLGIPVVDLSRNGRRSITRAISGGLGQIQRFRPALIHADGVYGKLCAGVLGLITRTPVLATVGNTLLASPPRVVLRRRALLGRAVWWADQIGGRWLTTHFMAISAAVRETVIAAYRVPSGRVSVVHRGVDLREMVPDPPEAVARLRAHVAPADAWPLLLNVGRLCQQKGQEHLIRALPQVRRHFPKAYALVAGRGPLEAHYRAVARECGVSGAVRLLGLRSDVKALLQCADIFVFPSLYEGLGGAMLEAMAMGRPIVASRIPPIAEAVGSIARLVPVGDPNALAEAIVTLAARRDQWPTLAAQARRRVEERYDITANALAFGALCERVAASPARGRVGAARAA